MQWSLLLSLLAAVQPPGAAAGIAPAAELRSTPRVAATIVADWDAGAAHFPVIAHLAASAQARTPLSPSKTGADRLRQEAVAEVDEGIDFVRFYTRSMREHNGYEEDTLPF